MYTNLVSAIKSKKSDINFNEGNKQLIIYFTVTCENDIINNGDCYIIDFNNWATHNPNSTNVINYKLIFKKDEDIVIELDYNNNKVFINDKLYNLRSSCIQIYFFIENKYITFTNIPKTSLCETHSLDMIQYLKDFDNDIDFDIFKQKYPGDYYNNLLQKIKKYCNENDYNITTNKYSNIIRANNNIYQMYIKEYNEKMQAATKIQAAVRGNLVRKTEFGKKVKVSLNDKMSLKKIKKLCKRYHIRLTVKSGGKRIPKSEKVLKTQLKNKIKKIKLKKR